MRVIHSLAWYFPESKAGTETYVSQLVRELSTIGVDSTVVAARDGAESDSYVHEGIEVFRYPVNENPKLDQLRGRRPYGGFEVFSEWLKTQRADIYHQHSFNGGCGLHHLREAKSLGLKTVMTVHMPNCVCLRGTMMFRGKTACDGNIERNRCGACWGMSRGLPKPVASAASRLPMFLSKRADSVDLSLFTIIATPSLVEAHRNQLKELSNLADRIVVISRWLYDALSINDVPQEKLVLSHTGGPANGHTPVIKSSSSSLRLGFLGRCTKDKGLHVLIRALRQLPPDVPIQLVVYALKGGDGEAEYEADVRQSASKDSRISFKDPVDRGAVFKTLQTFDLLAIPSQCMETGPLVALEAHAAGV
ncbi:MAG TPA: glycosyltransferase, partial [Pyrinomonadaceae bacterium]|nr:glycosyltransferase [Pyrinomonadaceae bacterium]